MDSACFSTPSSTPGTPSDKENNECFLLFKTYIMENHMSDIVRILLEEEVNVHYSLKIDGSDLLENCFTMTEFLFFQPEKILKLFDQAFYAATCIVFGKHTLKSHMTLKPFLHVRLTKLPSCSEIWRDRVPKSVDIGRFLALEGTVIRTSSAKILEYKKEYMCSKCKNVFSLQADFQLHYIVPTPTCCPVSSECSGKKFVVMAGGDGSTGPKKCKDYQEIRVQEQVRKLSMGTIPRALTIILEDDLVDSCKPGDDIVIFGSVACRWYPVSVGKPCDLELVLKANNIEVCNERHSAANGIDFDELQDEFECFWASYNEDSFMKARNHILASLCPQVYGLYVVKLAVALVLAGGVPRTDASGSRVRGECHLLLVGDPGTGKSQFLKYAAKVTPRSVLTTGIGSSTAGLTVSAIRDGPHWTLEAGALVLADGGICCIDEFSGIKEHERSAIHEAMEQQTISVAKAGLVCKLNTRTSILAATNPKLGKYDETSSVSLNIGMASPLLSRFDLVLVLLDAKNLHWDSVVADYLLMGKGVVEKDCLNKSNLWSLSQMQGYFGIIRQINPSLSSEADQVLRAYYRCHRQAHSRNAARTTIRLLESLIRLSEAHARLMFRNVVTIQDAIAAVTVVESSMQGGSLLPTGSILHSCFPKDADLEYQKHSRLVLQCLNLDNLMHCETASSSTTNAYKENVSEACSASVATNESTTKEQSQTVIAGNILRNSTNMTEEKQEVSNHCSFNIADLDQSFGSSAFHSTHTSSFNKNNKSMPNVSESTQPFPAQSQHFSQNKNSVNCKQVSSNIFCLDNEDCDFMLNFGDEDTPPSKKQKTSRFISTNAKFNFTSNNFLSKKHVPDASTSFDSLDKNAACVASCNNSFLTNLNQETPLQSQVSLFSLDALNSPKGLSQKFTNNTKKLHLPHSSTRSESSSTCASSTNLSHDKANTSNTVDRSNIFKLPTSEAGFNFFDYDCSDAFFQNSSSTVNVSPNILCKKKSENNSFLFTLDPSIIENMCSDVDFGN